MIVGHGPSVLSGLGAVIDQHTVVRLKDGLRVKPKPDPVHWGTRTDYLCGRSLVYQVDKTPFWHFDDPPKWMEYYQSFRPRHKKPTTGLSAVFMAIDKLSPDEIALIGYDRLLNPHDQTSRKWNEPKMQCMYGHDQRAEHECLMSLPVRIIDLAKEKAEA